MYIAGLTSHVHTPGEHVQQYVNIVCLACCSLIMAHFFSHSSSPYFSTSFPHSVRLLTYCSLIPYPLSWPTPFSHSSSPHFSTSFPPSHSVGPLIPYTPPYLNLLLSDNSDEDDTHDNWRSSRYITIVITCNINSYPVYKYTKSYC